MMRLGIWLDCEKAFVISVSEDDYRTEWVHSNVENRVRYDGETKSSSRLGGMFVNPSRKRMERRKHQLREYFASLTPKIRGSEAILLFGPADTAKHLFKEIRQMKGFRDIPVRVEKADKMTENQMIARVREYYAGWDEKEAGKKGRA